MAKKAETAEATSEEKITQKEAVKRAIAAGHDQPKEGVAYIKGTFGMDLSPGAFSTLKTLLKSGSKPGGKKRGRPAASATGSATSVMAKGKTSNAAELARGVKALVAQHGADAVAEMAKVFAY